MRKNILWDLDRTLTNPHQGIIRCFQLALEKTGYTVPDENEILSFNEIL